ncbi:MAG: peptidylprolyl isomerase [Spirulina sp. DLM2.Bin59]|nr:MAG: peptidylprolyl isomerase [Spirulina sp. DLM2.Bin59]
MSTVLNTNPQNLDAEAVVNLLTSPQVLPHLLRELTIERAIASITYTDFEFKDYCDQLAQQPQYFNAAREQIERVAPRQLKLQKFKEAAWGAQVEAEFLNQQERYDQVLFSLIQTDNLEIIQELYFRLRESEADFAELATRYSQGPEARTNGLVGPLELSNLHPKLAQMLRISQPGQVSPPFRVDQWVVIVRLERYIPVKFSEGLRQRLMQDRFEAWMQQAIAQQADAIHIPDLLNLPPALPNSPRPVKTPETPEEEQENSPLDVLEADATITEDTEAPLPPSGLPVPPIVDMEQSKRRVPRFTEAVLMSLVPLALGGWSLAALFGGGKDGAPISEAAMPSENPTAIAVVDERPDPQLAFHEAVNHANAAVAALPQARTANDWQDIAEHWQAAVAGMRAVPVDHPNYAQAQEKVIEYQGYEEYALQRSQDVDLAFYVAVQDAERAVEVARQAQNQGTWDDAVLAWDQAVVSMEKVPETSQFYSLAQEKAIEYQVYLQYVKLLRDGKLGR